MGSVLGSLVDQLARLPPTLLLAAAFLLPAAEASVLVGVVVPGETAVILAGVVAAQGRLPLAAVIAAAVLGAILGDQVGFLVGRRWGEAVLARVPHRLVHPATIQRALGFVERRGVWAVLIGRWTASLRALVPGLAGAAGMQHRPFTIANAIGGTAWAATVAVAGYLAGASYRRVEAQFGRVGEVVSLAIVGVIVLVVVTRRLRAHFTSNQT